MLIPAVDSPCQPLVSTCCWSSRDSFRQGQVRNVGQSNSVVWIIHSVVVAGIVSLLRLLLPRHPMNSMEATMMTTTTCQSRLRRGVHFCLRWRIAGQVRMTFLHNTFSPSSFDLCLAATENSVLIRSRLSTLPWWSGDYYEDYRSLTLIVVMQMKVTALLACLLPPFSPHLSRSFASLSPLPPLYLSSTQK